MPHKLQAVSKPNIPQAQKNLLDMMGQMIAQSIINKVHGTKGVVANTK